METNTLLPGDPLPYNSKFYIQRPPIETNAYEELLKPGSLLRITAPSKMGKTSLMLRLIHQVTNQGYSIVKIDFRQADRQVFVSTNKFLRWFFVNIARQLSLKFNLDEYWDDTIGSKVCASIYLEEVILATIENPLVIVLQEVNYIFEHPQIAADFLSLIRSWHEQSKQSQIWQKLRLVIIYSREIYIPLNINQSPFNVGLSVKLTEFNQEQVTEFAKRHNYSLLDKNIEQLMQLVGGHPYLIHLAIFNLQKENISFQKLIDTAINYNGIYSSHLRHLLIILQKEPDLAQAYHQIINGEYNSHISTTLMYKLDSLGLIKVSEAETCQPSCEIYRLFFQQENLNFLFTDYILFKQLEDENKILKSLVNVDTLTKIPNRRHFDVSFHEQWQRMKILQEPISLILLDIDRFKLFNDTYGHQAGDDCLYQVAQTIHSMIQKLGYIFARYGGEEFALVLSQTDAYSAMILAEKIREKIKSSEIQIINFMTSEPKQISANITVSLGIVSIVPNESVNPQEFFTAADQALYEAKKMGRNCSVISSKFDDLISSNLL